MDRGAHSEEAAIDDLSGQTPALGRDEVIRALQDRERFLTGALGSLESFMTVDQEWRCTFANAAAGALIGIPAEDLVGRDLRDLTPPGMFRQLFPLLANAMGKRAGVELDASDPADEMTLHVRAYPLADGGLALYLQNVTEKALAQSSLRRSEERYRELVESVNSAVLRWDRDGIICFVNDHVERLFGWQAEELIGRPVGMLVPEPGPGDPDLSHLANGILAHPERYETHVNENVRKDGTRLWVAWTNRALLDEQGEVREVLAIGNDITELIRTQTALRESEERLNLALSVGGIATWDFRVDTGETVWNREHFLMLGYEPGEVEPGYDPFLARVHPDDAAAVDAAFRRSLDTAADYRAEFRVVRPGGVTRDISAVGHIELDGCGAPLRQYGVMFDVTERLEAERLVRETAAEKAAQLERSRLARDLHDSVTQALFAATLKAEALTAGGAPAAVDALAEEVRRLNRGALAQMRTLLLELRGDPLQDVPIAQLLRNLAEATESRAGVSVWLTIDGGEAMRPDVHVAVYRIAQEALNNVARHAGATNAWVTLHVDPDQVRLTVRDDGHGFQGPPADPSHLGLTLMSERAAEAGGFLDVTARPGRGTTVSFHWEDPAA